MTEMIRLAQWKDIEKVSGLRLQYLELAHHGLTEEQRKQIYASNLSYLNHHLNKDCFIAVTEVDDQLVSCAYMLLVEKAANLYFPNGKHAEVYGVYTKPAYRRRQYATRQMELLIEKAEELEATYIELGASEEGLEVYKKLGFVIAESEYQPMQLNLKAKG